jgi:hypothetical protein
MGDELGAFPAASCAAGDDAFGDFDAFAGGEADDAFGGLGGEWGEGGEKAVDLTGHGDNAGAFGGVGDAWGDAVGPFASWQGAVAEEHAAGAGQACVQQPRGEELPSQQRAVVPVAGEVSGGEVSDAGPESSNGVGQQAAPEPPAHAHADPGAEGTPAHETSSSQNEASFCEEQACRGGENAGSLDGISCAVAPPRGLDELSGRCSVGEPGSAISDVAGGDVHVQHEQGIHALGVPVQDDQAEECVAQEEHASAEGGTGVPQLCDIQHLSPHAFGGGDAVGAAEVRPFGGGRDVLDDDDLDLVVEQLDIHPPAVGEAPVVQNALGAHEPVEEMSKAGGEGAAQGHAPAFGEHRAHGEGGGGGGEPWRLGNGDAVCQCLSVACVEPGDEEKKSSGRADCGERDFKLPHPPGLDGKYASGDQDVHENVEDGEQVQGACDSAPPPCASPPAAPPRVLYEPGNDTGGFGDAFDDFAPTHPFPAHASGPPMVPPEAHARGVWASADEAQDVGEEGRVASAETETETGFVASAEAETETGFVAAAETETETGFVASAEAETETGFVAAAETETETGFVASAEAETGGPPAPQGDTHTGAGNDTNDAFGDSDDVFGDSDALHTHAFRDMEATCDALEHTSHTRHVLGNTNDAFAHAGDVFGGTGDGFAHPRHASQDGNDVPGHNHVVFALAADTFWDVNDVSGHHVNYVNGLAHAHDTHDTHDGKDTHDTHDTHDGFGAGADVFDEGEDAFGQDWDAGDGWEENPGEEGTRGDAAFGAVGADAAFGAVGAHDNWCHDDWGQAPGDGAAYGGGGVGGDEAAGMDDAAPAGLQGLLAHWAPSSSASSGAAERARKWREKWGLGETQALHAATPAQGGKGAANVAWAGGGARSGAVVNEAAASVEEDEFEEDEFGDFEEPQSLAVGPSAPPFLSSSSVGLIYLPHLYFPSLHLIC